MLNTKAVSLSMAITVEIMYFVCAFFSYFFTAQSVSFFNTWLHAIDVTGIISTRPFTFPEFTLGAVSIFIAAYFTGFVFTGLYNALSKVFQKR